ncbi:MAG: hypothetical protein A2Y33_03120 [Spirochaetes bacterium GWF1_51_8]|nr:MAG: hypothetical protein A2Y33_03120 [Spirochaetes bacterium GWF1_51_8]
MKKALVLSVLAVSLFGTAAGYGATLSGGIWRMGFFVDYCAQQTLSDTLVAAGYTPALSGVSYGMSLGGGGIGGNFYLGGWGTVISSKEVLKSSTSARTLTYGGGFGGVEFGYIPVYSGGFFLMPSISVLWGGIGLSFETNMSFANYLANPVEFNPVIGANTFSLSVGLTTGYLFEDRAGFLLRLQYIYTPSMSWSGVVLSDVPAHNQHSFLAAIELAFGGIIEGKSASSEIEADDLPSGLPDEPYVQ